MANRFRSALALLLPALLVAAPAPARASGANLARALDSVRADNLRADLHFIASDRMRGRDTPSPELAIAARFLVARVERLGLRPGAQDGFLHRYPLDLRRLDAERSQLGLSGPRGARTLRPGAGYWLSSPFDLDELEVRGPIVWCGTGEEDELEGLELGGRWALVAGTEESARALRRRIQRAGAAGLLLCTGSDPAQRERYAQSLERLRTGRVSWPEGERRERAPWPALALDEDGARALWELAGLPDPGPGSPAPPVGTVLALEAREERRIAGGGQVEVENVCAWWPGSDPELAREAILVSAHYDHVGAQGDEIYPGADDNGSGTCGLLALAEALVANGPLRRSVLLIWVSGEEKGLFGSRAWSDAPWLPDAARPIANLNIDMIGRNAPEQLLVTPTKERDEDYNGLVRRIERLAPLEGLTDLGTADDYYNRSDQAMFARLGIPVAFLFADVHEDYHRPTDTADKIDYDKARRVVRLLMRVLDELQADELDL
jgi:hypothetical protein